MYKREHYLNILRDYKDINLIKVITGVRRCGKSTLLLQFKDYLLESKISEENIIYMNFESSEWFHIVDYFDLTKYIKEKYTKNKLYILLDEIQNVFQWEKAVNALLVDIDCDIYVTGSNAYMLSSELTTLLAGRVLTLKLYPLSFREYNEMNRDNSLDINYSKYIQFGGMPLISNLPNEEVVLSYLRDIKDVVLKNDVIARNKIKDVALLDKLLAYVASTVGNLTTVNHIHSILNQNGSNTHNETTENYLKTLENAYVIYRAARYSLDGKEFLKTQGKYYFVDNGIRNIIQGFHQFDSGSSFENVVYMELLRRGYEVYVGKYKELEIDFVARKLDDIKYYQVCRSLDDEKVLEREKKALLAVKDNYPKYILTNDSWEESILDGITIKSICSFLLDD